MNFSAFQPSDPLRAEALCYLVFLSCLQARNPHGFIELVFQLPRFVFAMCSAAALIALTNSFASSANAVAVNSANAKTQPRRVFTSVDEVIGTYGAAVRKKLKPVLQAVDVPYPPAQMTWICLKEEKVLLLFAKDRSGKQKQILGYPIVGASGAAGPKLKEGDLQVPEGFYRIPSFHPNVIAHMALDVNYPNEEDRLHAKSEHRRKLGCDILIHGSRWSTGCLAMGNEPIEEMFVLAYDCGIKNIRLIFAPCNLNAQKPKLDFTKQPAWLPALYKRLSYALKDYPIDISSVPPPPKFEDSKSEKK